MVLTLLHFALIFDFWLISEGIKITDVKQETCELISIYFQTFMSKTHAHSSFLKIIPWHFAWLPYFRFRGNYSFFESGKCGNFHIVSALWQIFTS